MSKKLKDKSITQMFGSIAAAQTLVEQSLMSVEATDKGFTCSFDLLATLFELLGGVSLPEKIIETISDKLSDPNCTWLQGIEESVKMLLHANFLSLLNCEMSPIIPNNLIGGYQFANNLSISIDQNGEGIRIPISDLDFTGILGHCPGDETNAASRGIYMDCRDENQQPLAIQDLWKHDDFNAFLWYVKNKGVYGNLTERNKLIWDNRYKTKPYTKYERKPESFFTKTFPNSPDKNGVIPFDDKYLQEYNNKETTTYKKKQILEVQYVEADGLNSDAFIFRLPASNYYKTRKLSTKKNKDPQIWRLNKTIFEFNQDFLMSIKLYDAKSILNQLINNTLGPGNLSFNFSVTRDDELMEEYVDGIIDKVIQMDDLQIENDDYMSFSNEEYNTMLENYKNRKIYSNLNSSKIDSLKKQIKETDVTHESGNAMLTTSIAVLTGIVDSMANNEATKTNGNWKFEYDYKFELIRMFVYPFIKPIFSPKVMTVILMNSYIMGNPLKIGEKKIDLNDIQTYLVPLLKNIIIAIKDMIVDMVYGWVLEKLTKLLTKYSLEIYIEQLNTYRLLIENLIKLTIEAFSKLQNMVRNKNGGVNNITYADIK